MKVSKLLVAAAIAASTTVGNAGAQTNCGGSGEIAIGTLAAPGACAVTSTVSSAVPSVARLSIDNATTTLTAPKATDFGAAGNGTQVTTTGPTLSVSANVAHTVTASAPANFTPSNGGGTKPATDLQIKTNSGNFVAIGTIGNASAPTNLATYALTYGTKYNWTVDTPGSYSLMLTFTLTSP